jgi:hypothetical protein
MKKPHLLLLLLFFGLSDFLYSENNLNISKKDGSKQYSPISQIRKLTFSASGINMQIHLTSGTIISDSINLIQTMSFDTVGYGDILSILPEFQVPPTDFQLSQNFPNPFNPSTIIRFDVPEKQLVSLKVYNVLGEEVATLVNGEISAGQHSAMFDASNTASGAYFYRLIVGHVYGSKKMIINK